MAKERRDCQNRKRLFQESGSYAVRVDRSANDRGKKNEKDFLG